MRSAVAIGVAAVAAAVLPAAASAHARLVTSTPADRAVLASAPADVRLTFTEPVRPAPGIEAVRTGGGSVIAGDARADGRALLIPLRADLAEGVYTVRWRAISDDGHEIGGVLAFRVGAGAPPTPSLSAGSTGPGADDYAARWLFFIGILLAAGAAVFQLVIRRPEGRRELRAASLVLATGFAAAIAGGLLLLWLSNAGFDTRFGTVVDVGLLVAAIGFAAALNSLVLPPLRLLALAAALALLPVPTLAGHALDRGRSALDVVVDLAHVSAAAVWTGGVLALVVALWLGGEALLGPVARKFSALALGAVVVLAATGVGRALEELDSFSQLWTTGYGRAILVKTGLLAVIVALAARNRYVFLSGPLERLRAGAAAEGVLLLGVVVAVAVLTALPPGQTSAAPPPAPPVQAGPPQLPPPDASLVLGRRAGNFALGLALRPTGRRLRLTATLVSPRNTGVDGLALGFRVNGGARAAASGCGSGCYAAEVPNPPLTRTVTVSFPGRSVRFAIPPDATPADALLRRATARYRALRSVNYRERLSSGRTTVTSSWKQVAPDRFEYTIPGGPAGIVVGRGRWDRTAPQAPWIKSTTQPFRVPSPIWPERVTTVRQLGRTATGSTLSFLDPSLPAWFTVRFDRRLLPVTVEMTAPAHFMHHDYLSFNRPLEVKPPR